jgi:hypothetical protein
LQQLFRGQDFTELSAPDGEFIKPQDRVARATAKKDDSLAVRREFRRDRLA